MKVNGIVRVCKGSHSCVWCKEVIISDVKVCLCGNVIDCHLNCMEEHLISIQQIEVINDPETR